jgi:hypothetical protein
VISSSFQIKEYWWTELLLPFPDRLAYLANTDQQQGTHRVRAGRNWGEETSGLPLSPQIDANDS